MLHTRLLPFVSDMSVAGTTNIVKIIQQITNVFGTRIDTVIHNAGLLEPIKRIQNMNEVDYEYVEKHFHLNVISVMKLTTLCIPYLKQSSQPRIVMISSGAAKQHMPGWSTYCASKAALNSITGTLAAENPDITTIAISPGPVESNMQQLIRQTGGTEMTQQDYDKFVNLHNNNELTKEIDAALWISAAAMLTPKELNGQFLSIKDSVAQELIQKYIQTIDTVKGPNV